ncbi:hypothetical protein M426DRAFT_170217 [Hypoxylon sp. CI-4A]|nr:hypothetical protein M426DRAFT_170217 [Hypoxylon sp. CI-4A]
MVGIPKSNRCTFCKLRKTKCDENWPTCGTCARADKVCSGARSTYKFVVNGSHNEVITTPAQPDSHHDTIIPLRSNSSQLLQDISSKPASPGDAIIVDMKEYTASRGPGTFHRMRLTQARRPRSIKSSRLTPTPTPTPAATPSPRSSPVLDPSDRLAGQLVACLEAAADTGHDMQIWGPSIRIIPQRLRSESRVLRHTVELVVATWSNSRRDVLAPELWLDLSLHMRALGSLRKALEEPEPEPESEELGLGLVTDTIAAQWLLQKLEVSERVWG